MIDPIPTRAGITLLSMIAAVMLTGCQTAYYGAMEKLGYEKRDLLVDRVEDARAAQQEARQQFEDALEQFIAVTDFQGGEVEAQYRRLKSGFEASESRAGAVSERIRDVEQVARDLFTEWEEELEQYSSQSLRRSSERQLADTRRRYDVLIGKMRQAERRIEPVLNAFRDRVLFLKHNLNAQAISSLRANRAEIEADIAALVADMNRSIAEADAFIRRLSSS